MLGVRLYLAQRITAIIMAPLVLIHLFVIIYAVRGGLDASEILARTQGSFLWASLYGLFVIAASVHAAIGVRVIAHETVGVTGARLAGLTWAVAVVCLLLGARAVYAVIF